MTLIQSWHFVVVTIGFVGTKLYWEMSTKDIAPVIVGFLVQWVASV
jgi:hypothetical protein